MEPASRNRRGRLPRRVLALVLVVVLAAGALALGCREAPPEGTLAGSRPNIVLVVLCSARYHHLGAAGSSRELTPFLDRLAAEGVFFENAVSASSWTKPSAASLMTGLTPNVHQLLDFYSLQAIQAGEVGERRVLPEAFVTLPETLRSNGYETFCRVNNVHAGKFFELTQGCEDSLTRHGLDMAGMVEELDGWLATRKGRDDRDGPDGSGGEAPFFAYLFNRDLHTPYAPPYESYRRLHRAGELPSRAEFGAFRREVNDRVWKLTDAGEPVPEELQHRWIDLYDAQLPPLDRALAGLRESLERVGHADDTLIVVTADHGDRFFEHGDIDHGSTLDDPVIKIPMIFNGPGVAGGQRRPGVTRSIDLFPTLAAVAGAEPPPVLQGRSLVPLLADPAASLPAVSAFSSFGGHLHAVRMGRYKLIAGWRRTPELYDLESDPYEHHDLRDAEPETARRLQAELRRWLEEEERLAAETAPVEKRELPPEVVDELRALGYL